MSPTSLPSSMKQLAYQIIYVVLTIYVMDREDELCLYGLLKREKNFIFAFYVCIMSSIRGWSL